MNAAQNPPLLFAGPGGYPRAPLLAALMLSLLVVGLSLAAALLLPAGYPLSIIADGVEAALCAGFTLLALQNTIRSHGPIRVFWFFMFLGAAMWLGSLFIWSVTELWLRRGIPDVPFADILLFVKA